MLYHIAVGEENTALILHQPQLYFLSKAYTQSCIPLMLLGLLCLRPLPQPRMAALTPNESLLWLRIKSDAPSGSNFLAAPCPR